MGRKRKVAKKRRLKVVGTAYSPTKAEKEKTVKLPKRYEEQSFDHVVAAAIRPVEIEEADRPEK